MYTVYDNIKENIPGDMPTPMGKVVMISIFVDANLYFDLITGRACTGILTMLNQTPIEWYSKKQATVATATFGSEFVAARIATEQAEDLRYTIRMLGIPLAYSTYMFGDNSSVVTQATIAHSALTKRHNALAYHKVREAVAQGWLQFHYIPGSTNLADVLTKFMRYLDWYPLLRPVLFWKGDTAEIPTNGV